MLISTLIIILIILLSFSVHEFAHAWVANKLGDPTPRYEGRLSLNPLNHWDPIGTSLLVGLLFLRGLGIPVFVFGWGKPVPVDERHFANPRLDFLKTSLAGPLVNLIFAVGLALLLRAPFATGSLIKDILVTSISINVFLAIFNLLPIPPLDGSRLIRLFMSDETYIQFEQYSSTLMIGLMIMIFAFPGFLDGIVSKVINILIP